MEKDRDALFKKNKTNYAENTKMYKIWKKNPWRKSSDDLKDGNWDNKVT